MVAGVLAWDGAVVWLVGAGGGFGFCGSSAYAPGTKEIAVQPRIAAAAMIARRLARKWAATEPPGIATFGLFGVIVCL